MRKPSGLSISPNECHEPPRHTTEPHALTQRYFISIDIAIEVAESLMHVQQDLQAVFEDASLDAQWTHPEQLHLSMKYLGELDSAILPHIEESLEQLVLPLFPFQIHHRKIATDPGKGVPRNLFNALDAKGAEVTKLLHQALERDLSKIGFASDRRPFHPMVHLARLRSKCPREQLMELLTEHAPDRFGTSTIKDFALWCSELTHDGPVYTVINRFTLGGRHEPI